MYRDVILLILFAQLGTYVGFGTLYIGIGV